MGFFDKFKKTELSTANQENKKEMQNEVDVPVTITEDGKIQVELYENEPKPGQFYNVTRLILDGKTKTIEGQKVCQGLVSWYGENDGVIEDKKTGKLIRPREVAYKKILFQIDEKNFLNDPQYRYDVMKSLLNQSRVNRYLNEGLRDDSRKPCGNYIGGIYPGDGMYKFFSPDIGKAVHNSDEMKALRARYKEEAAKVNAGRGSKLELEEMCK